MNAAQIQGIREIGSAMVETECEKWGVFVKVAVGARSFESCKVFDVSETHAKDATRFYKGAYARPMSR